MANPMYDSDLKILENNGYDLGAVMSSETIVIVTGCCTLAELLDRQAAEFLRSEIDRRGSTFSGATKRRGIIVGDLWWYRDESLWMQPVISVGGPAVNALTGQIIQAGTTRGEGGALQAHQSSPKPKIALWGQGASDTWRSVHAYAFDPAGLSKLITIVWK